MFAFFEKLVDPYPTADQGQAPQRFWPFIYFYSRPMVPWLVVIALLAALVSVLELTFFAYIGELVDWLAASDKQTFFDDHGTALFWMGALVLIGFPLLVLTQSLFVHQTVFGNYPMLVRCLIGCNPPSCHWKPARSRRKHRKIWCPETCAQR